MTENFCILKSSRWLRTPHNGVCSNTCSCCISGLSYASHTVGFTPPTSLTRAGMSYYNSPGLHVQHMGASHGITVSIRRGGSHPWLLLVVAASPQETRGDALRPWPFFSLPPEVWYQILVWKLKSFPGDKTSASLSVKNYALWNVIWTLASSLP